jgi:hypothetical protein
MQDDAHGYRLEHDVGDPFDWVRVRPIQMIGVGVDRGVQDCGEGEIERDRGRSCP